MGDAARSLGRRLDSWKGIAAFFGRDERTVRRWEKENSLPIHRVPGGAKGRVFAYEDELSQWLRTPQALIEEKYPEETAQAEASPAISARRPDWLTPAKWAIALLVCGLLAWGILAYRKNHRFAVHASGTGASANRGVNPNAEEFYLKGRYYWNKRTPDDLNKAVDLFTQAIVQDPGYAPAYVGLADCYNLLREFSAMPPSEAYPRARAAAEKAVEIDPSSAEAHNSLAFALFWGYIDVAGAEREFERALALEPNNAQTHHWHATFLVELGRFQDALKELERARVLDPSSTPILADKGFTLGMAGQTQQAIGLLKQVEAAEPAFLSAHKYLRDIYFSSEQYGAYFEEARATARLQNDSNAEAVLAEQQRGFAAGGKLGLLKARLRSDQQLYRRELATDFAIASDYALLGEDAEALRHLRAAYEKHDSSMVMILVHPPLRSLHRDPAFRELVAKLGLPPLS
jgi:tetratricopeptide (TPR) repeat protein